MKILGTAALTALAIVVAILWDAVAQDANAMAPHTPGGFHKNYQPTTHPNHHHVKKH